MNKYLIILIILTASCSITRRSAKRIATGNKLTFQVENVNLSDTLSHTALSDIFELNKNDTLKKIFLESLQRKWLKEKIYPNEIHIELEQNGWRKQRFVDNKSTDIYQHFFTNDTIKVYSAKEPYHLINSIVRVYSDCEFEIITNPKKRKSIAGYDCYFVKIEESYGSEKAMKILGTTVYEMYVTTKINLPMNSLLNNECEINGFFPLEAKKYVANDTTIYSTFKLINVE